MIGGESKNHIQLLPVTGQSATINGGVEYGIGFVAEGCSHNSDSLVKCGARVTLRFKARLIDPNSGKVSATRDNCKQRVPFATDED